MKQLYLTSHLLSTFEFWVNNNKKKSILIPQKSLQLTSFITDSEFEAFSFPAMKILRFAKEIRKIK